MADETNEAATGMSGMFREALGDLILKRTNAGDTNGLSNIVAYLTAMLMSGEVVVGSFIMDDVLVGLSETIASCVTKKGLTSDDWKDESKHPLFIAAFKEAAEKIRNP